MYSLRRISISNWYLIDAKDIEIRGEAALIGPTGAGKSSIQDAIQTVIAGGNQNRLHLNASASGRSSRSVLEYCLGMTGDAAEDGRPLRKSCETILALTFVNEYTNVPISVGIAFAARHGDSREEVLSRFIVPGHAFSIEAIRREENGVSTLAPFAEIAAEMRRTHPEMTEYKSSAERFTADMLSAMRGPASPPNARHFLRAFSNALAFKPIFDPTVFVREFVLEPDPLDVERVRTSIATWRELEALIEEAEAKHHRVVRTAARFRAWGRARMEADRLRWRAAAADSCRAGIELRAALELLATRAASLDVERRVLTSRREWIRNWDEEIRSKQALLGAASGEAQLRQIDAEAKLAERDIADAGLAWSRIQSALADILRLSALVDRPGAAALAALDAARQALSLAPAGQPLHETLRGRGDRLQALVEEARRIDGLQVALDDLAHGLQTEVRRLEADHEQAASGRARPHGGFLSREVVKLLSALEAAGIPAVPLCDVVGIAEPDWQYAAESLLGRGREAIIVPPPLLSRAFDLMWQDRNAFAGCTLVKTSATASTRSFVQPGSILEALSTEDEHARAFLTVRIGAFRKAETEADLDRLDRGIMKNGKTSSGMGLSVQRDLKDMLLGRGAGASDDGADRDRRARIERDLTEAKARLQRVRDAARRLPGLLAVLAADPQPFDLEHRVGTARLRLDALARDRRAVEDSDAGGLRAEMEDIKAERDAHAAELTEEVEPRIEALQQAVAHATARAGVAEEKLKAAHAQRRRAFAVMDGETHRALGALDPETPSVAAVCRAFRAEIRAGGPERRDLAARLATMRNEARAAADLSDGAARREQLAALRDLGDYASQWRIALPAIDAESMMAGYRWIAEEQRRLEENDLRSHRDACARAAEEMRRMLREDLLARLSEKLGKVSHRMDGMNRLLKRHRFTGQTYAFTFAVDGRFARLHDLATKAAEDGLTDEIFEASMDDVEAMIEGQEDAALMADYRQYFTFEITMTDAKGGRTSLSSRAMKGSGGEAQVPFYVAIAASLSLAYFPGHIAGRPAGMGLALFDEAFNKLDVPNTQALLRFFRDMGLQLLIAGPEDKRATFTEVLDTIVLVNKSLDGTSVYIDTEHPREAAKRALADLNPDHRAPSTYRSAAE
ncbi:MULTISPECIES: SbcC/MukB-like Walker B domain-containing protein [unclassified Aureimonas]|uniref:SbcC/MukB-like Walker B domain-containing protein n=1 Tax=unclassified Aureimonas TaxID=2615206 RepID=UPI0006F4FB63|nr:MULTISPECIES: SbcC/MukB-like Walker B domain-containing protein [unclassified Aureimonas]KQT52111.1 hypothetical protein ASG62_15705 [Aureimonas sp. Leaf427]KQT70656.1 hypothetical protein ASG54_22245 [Aureimonas sp. Leaf460]